MTVGSDHAQVMSGKSVDSFYLQEAMLACDSVPLQHPALASATLILDLAGRVLCCNPGASRLIAPDERATVGCQVRTLIPDLPLRAETPGYNLAYAIFWAVGESWRAFGLRDRQGQYHAIQVRLEIIELNGMKHIVVRVRSRELPGNRPSRHAQVWRNSPIGSAAMEASLEVHPDVRTMDYRRTMPEHAMS